MIGKFILKILSKITISIKAHWVLCMCVCSFTGKTNLIRRKSQHKTVGVENGGKKMKTWNCFNYSWLHAPPMLAHISTNIESISIVCIVFVTVFPPFFLRVLTKAREQAVHLVFSFTFSSFFRSSFDLQSLLLQEWNKNFWMIIELFVGRKIKKRNYWKENKTKSKTTFLWEDSSKHF